ncbi:MAG: phosphonate monoester hydrolase [Betaproteobacteria bacterium]|nr:phosphonate monoester hydrolase [Betaproteobacteria bacterium]NBT68329.1 phosphonate monoester hydrolase [Betaproteobacteria bacterium]
MSQVKNVLFIMADQLRRDHLSCYGHPHLKTPTIDALAKRGVRFTQALTSSPVCGPARMSLYTGRTAFSHGASWNFVPLHIGEFTLGDYIRPHGIRVALAGKTHMRPDLDGMQQLGISAGSDLGVLASECGFEPWERDDGEHPNQKFNPDLAYNKWLLGHGYESPNPWNDFANSGRGPKGEMMSGWALRHSIYPARIDKAHSETAYMTKRAIDFIDDAGDKPWVLHLSYIKPHWPYIAPDPYHNMFKDVAHTPANKHVKEKETAHPVYQAFMKMEVGQTFSRDDVRQTVLPAYMGLIKEIDDQLARVMDHLKQNQLWDNTLIVFTSDHGDYMGDHWLGEKELFHEPSVSVPLIIVDPDTRADATRGQVDERLVEGIDILPTILEALNVKVPEQRIEGQSLLSKMRDRSDQQPWREAALSEIDYSYYQARIDLGIEPSQARAYMLKTNDWKYVYFKGFRPQLFDLKNDPLELEDLGESKNTQSIRSEFQGELLERLTERRNRVTVSDDVVQERTAGAEKVGIIIGRW